MSFKLTGWKILIKEFEPMKYVGNEVKFEVPEAYRARGEFGFAVYGIIEQITDELIEEKDTLEAMGIKIGDKVIVDQHVGTVMKLDEDKHRIILPEDILAVVTED